MVALKSLYKAVFSGVKIVDEVVKAQNAGRALLRSLVVPDAVVQEPDETAVEKMLEEEEEDLESIAKSIGEAEEEVGEDEESESEEDDVSEASIEEAVEATTDDEDEDEMPLN